MGHKVKRQVLQPSYYDKFSCIGGACENSCCARNWNITVDKKTYLKYKSFEDKELQSKLTQHLRRIRGEGASDNNYAQITLEEDNRCPMLLENGLCDLIIKEGEEVLSITCQTFPRAKCGVDPRYLELSMSTACPEMIRQLDAIKGPLEFDLLEKEFDIDSGLWRMGTSVPQGAPGVVAHTWVLREATIDILQNRNDPIWKRLLSVGMLMQRVTRLAEEGQYSAIPDAVQLYLRAAASGELAKQLQMKPPAVELRFAAQDGLFELLFGALMYSSGDNQVTQRILANFLNCSVEELVDQGEVDLQKAEFHLFTEQRLRRFWPDFLEQNHHLLEHYLVNTVFRMLFPCGTANATPYQQFVELANQYALLRSILCGMAVEIITTEQMIAAVALMQTVATHGSQMAEAAKTQSQEGLGGTAHMFALLCEDFEAQTL